MNVYEIRSIEDLIKCNSYLGRGIIIGMTPDRMKCAIAYFIMGRSENSRNRIFVKQMDNVMIKPYDESKVEDPSLIIYYPIKKYENNLIVTNGDQTTTIYNYLKHGDTFENALRTREFEPDEPNFTPRISGLVTFTEDNFMYKMSILKSGDPDGKYCSRYFYEYQPQPGLGHFIHTYVRDGNPLPTFAGEPERVEIPNDIDDFAHVLWNNLDGENKISMVVKYKNIFTGDMEDRFINKNK